MVKPNEVRPHLTLQNGVIHAAICLTVYRLSAVKKAAYRFADCFTLVLGSLDEEELPVEFHFDAEISEEKAVDNVRLFFRELLDQELREEVGEETRAIRSLILAQAFSRTDLIQKG